METKNQELVTDLLDGKKRWSIEKFLAKFDLPKVYNNLNYDSFRSISAALFHPNEIERNEWRIRDIFDLFDVDKDGILKEQEWKT